MERHWTEEIDRLRKVYADMGDGELEALALEAYSLTDAARLALKEELAVRQMDVKLRDAPVPKNASPFADVDLVVFRRVRDLPEALGLKQVLEDAGVPSCLGPDNSYDFDDFQLNFEGGVDFKILERDLQRAAAATRGLFPPEPEVDPGDVVYEARCPECHSTEIVFLGREGEPESQPSGDAQFHWVCDACEHQWTDDGIAQG